MPSLQGGQRNRATIRCQIQSLALRIPTGTAHHNHTARAKSPRWGEKKPPAIIKDSFSPTPLPGYAPHARRPRAMGGHQADIQSGNQELGSHQGMAVGAALVAGNRRATSSTTNSAIPAAVRSEAPTSGQW
ncbi:MAG: hypothetical protein ACK55Z_19300, partial [bacterium]